MKAVSELLTHSSLLVIGIIAMSLIIISFSNFLSRTERNLITLELNYITDSAKNKILEIYSLANSSSEYSYGSFKLNLPEKIGNRKYALSFYQNVLSVNASLEDEVIEITRLLNIEAKLNGTSYMPASINMEKSNGNISINLVG